MRRSIVREIDEWCVTKQRFSIAADELRRHITHRDDDIAADTLILQCDIDTFTDVPLENGESPPV